MPFLAQLMHHYSFINNSSFGYLHYCYMKPSDKKVVRIDIVMCVDD